MNVQRLFRSCWIDIDDGDDSEWQCWRISRFRIMHRLLQASWMLRLVIYVSLFSVLVMKRWVLNPSLSKFFHNFFWIYPADRQRDIQTVSIAFVRAKKKLIPISPYSTVIYLPLQRHVRVFKCCSAINFWSVHIIIKSFKSWNVTFILCKHNNNNNNNNNNNKLCGRPPQYAPPPASWPLTFWPWKWCPSHAWRALRLCQF